MNTPAASVLMCVFNEREDFLREAIDSILGQSFGDFEFVIVDDGSDSPATRRTLESCAAADARIRLVRKPHDGLTRSLNFGLQQCVAPIVFRQDSDDISDAWRLAAQHYFLLCHPDVAVVGTAFHCALENGRIFSTIDLPSTPDQIRSALWQGNVFCHGSVAFRRGAALAVGGYREELPCAQDYDLFWRMSEEYPTANLPEPLYTLRRTSNCVTARKTLLQDRCSECIRELARMRWEEGREDFPRAWARAGERVETPRGRMRASLRGGDQMLVVGQFRRASQLYFQAGMAYPWNWRVYGKFARLMVCLAVPGWRHEMFLPRRFPASHQEPQLAA